MRGCQNVEGEVAVQKHPHPQSGPAADAQGQRGRGPSYVFCSGPSRGAGHPGLTEGRWLGSVMLLQQLKEGGSRKERETETGRERERGGDGAAQGMLLTPVGTCTW